MANLSNIFGDDFDPNIDSTQWESITGVANTTFVGSDGNSLFFDNGSVREATSIPLDLTVAEVVKFDLIISNGSNGGENADSGEDVVLEFSTDGGNNFTVINTYDSEDFPGFTTIEETLPVEAQTSQTQLRWRQVSFSGQGFDNFGLDNIEVPFRGPGYYVNDVSVVEGNGGTTNAIFTVVRNGDLSVPGSVDFATSDGTAIAGLDYLSTSGSIQFSVGQQSQTITVEVIGDIVGESNETFFIDLANATGGLPIVDGTGTGTILNDDLIKVDSELSLLVDVSGSVDSTEYALQLQGYADAFNNPALFDLIALGNEGQVVVNFILWSSSNEQAQSIPWTLIDSFQASQAFASDILDLINNRPFSGSTAPGSAINFATPLFFNNDFDGTVQIIDVSGDGAENDGADTATARDAALAAGVDVINGIVINPSQEFGLLDFYQNEVIGGNNADGNVAFVLEAQDFTSFSDAIITKLEVEFTPPPLISITDVTLAEGESGNTQFIFEVSLTRSNTETVSVSFSTADDTAINGLDYVATSGTLTFAPGQTVNNITVDVLGENLVELDESFFVNLTNANNGVISDSQGIGTIINDDNLPEAENDGFNTDNVTPVNGNVLTNDNDVDGDSLVVVDINSSGGGVGVPVLLASGALLTLNDDGSFVYDPNGQFPGLGINDQETDSFTYTISDGNDGEDTATVTITITGVGAINNDPIAVSDSYIVNEDGTLNIDSASGVLSNDSDSDGDSLTASLISNVTNGTLTLNNNGSFSYQPFADFNGSDSFTYQANDGRGGSSLTTDVILTVDPVNDSPVVNQPIPDQIVLQNQSFNFTVPGNTFDDIDGDSLALSLGQTVPGLPNGITFDNGTGTFTGTTNELGRSSVEVVATDPSNASASDSFVLKVLQEVIVPDNSGSSQINGNAVDNFLDASNNDGKFRLESGAGNDVINGSDQRDVLLGGDGSDELLGRGGRDKLFGNDGDDLLDGGADIDILKGGLGADWFVLRQNDGTDRILDFNIAEGDLFALDQISFGQLTFNSNQILLGSEILAVVNDGNGNAFTGFNAALFTTV